ncbi:MAG: transglutaminase family protein [Synechococcales cyanobacterium CRU_2_2]|nr:transglutaminase family protein [Synechococcales cyanobacterium CRU_2_2]
MRLEVGCKMQFHAQTETPVVLMLRPRSLPGQWVVWERYVLEPHCPSSEYSDSYGNLCQRLMIPAGKFELAVTAEIATDSDIAVDPTAMFVPIEHLPSSVLRFLLPSRYCESDRLFDLAVAVTQDASPGYSQVESIRRWIYENFEYQYGSSDASTSALDIVATQQGICRDFAHLGISLCRSLNIPARMVVGYLYNLKPMDQHAWFEAYVGDRWYSFDATQAEPRGNRVVLAHGRDAADVALVTQFGPLSLETMEVWVRSSSYPQVSSPIVDSTETIQTSVNGI